MKIKHQPLPQVVEGFKPNDLVMFTSNVPEWQIDELRTRQDVFRVLSVGSTITHTHNCVVLENNGEPFGYCPTKYIRIVGQAKHRMFQGYSE